jgi:hypothetical protein
MAGNGMEWTRTLEGGSFPPDPAAQLKFLPVSVRGRSYYHSQPFRFADPPDYKLFAQGDPAVGFRVVVEP